VLRGLTRAAVLGVGLLLALPPNGAAAQSGLPVPCAAPALSGMRAWFTADGTAEDRVAALASVLRKGATFGPGLVSQAFSFDGIDDLVEVPHDPRLAPAQVSVEAWIRLDTLDSPGDGSRQLTLVSRRNPVNGSGYELAKMADDAFVFTIASAASEAFAAPSVTRAVPGRFHHLAGTFDGQAVRSTSTAFSRARSRPT